MDKRSQILDALEALLREGSAGTASVADIARKAGIAKGGMYYYFPSKEAALDALAHRQYAGVIAAAKAASDGGGDAIERLKRLLYAYRHTAVDASVDRFLHQTQNAAIHQKSMVDITLGLSPVVTEIIRKGCEAGQFTCSSPEGVAQIAVSVLVFLLDPGLFAWTDAEAADRLASLAALLEKGLSAPEGSFAFLYQGWTRQLHCGE